MTEMDDEWVEVPAIHGLIARTRFEERLKGTKRVTLRHMISTTTTSSTTSPSSLLLQSFAAAPAMFQAGECFLEDPVILLDTLLSSHGFNTIRYFSNNDLHLQTTLYGLRNQNARPSVDVGREPSPDVSLPQNIRFSFRAKAGKDELQAIPNPHAILEANAAQACRLQDANLNSVVRLHSTFVNRSHPDRIQAEDSRVVWQNYGISL
ncbi:uncharacterized protein LACBIDRAFT_330014 [Laccaria bicolor S238N-H82]|uniref:Predicted protein n=1 Tax=Laccaria bicolor (strain S238N-H82 / ATCC MYA-4686) TaxID=486041 RepID=B0DJX1_LACBS|nr:uncharacterized protein LACBIDRAFT_330014 [Laccaria bicolor S238N-H82]EDR05195.1 predicted protein [Laccaria bicolor S238N-H82]|eukprot:XP_001884160.1 predicted protein [Laccaria bicolor S238N-H82]